MLNEYFSHLFNGESDTLVKSNFYFIYTNKMKTLIKNSGLAYRDEPDQ